MAGSPDERTEQAQPTGGHQPPARLQRASEPASIANAGRPLDIPTAEAAPVSETHPSRDPEGLAEDTLGNQAQPPQEAGAERPIEDELPSEQPRSQARSKEDQLMSQAAPESALLVQLPEASPPNPPARAEAEVPIANQLLAETSLQFGQLEWPTDHPGTSQINPPLTDYGLTKAEERLSTARSPTDLTSTPPPEADTRQIEDQPDSLHHHQPPPNNPPSKPLILPPAFSSKLARIVSNGQPSKPALASSNIPPLGYNPLSIRSRLSDHKTSSKMPLPRSKIPGSFYQPNGATTTIPSMSKSVSSVFPPTSPGRLSDKITKPSKTSTHSFSSAQPPNTAQTLTPSRSMPKLRTTPSKSSLNTPSKPASSRTPSKPRSINPSTTQSLSRASSSLITCSKQSVSPVSPSTSPVRVPDKITKPSKTSTHLPFSSARPPNTAQTLTPSRSMPKLRTTSSKSSLNTPSKPASSTTPPKPRSINPSTTQSLSRAYNSLKKSHPASNGETAQASILDVLNHSSTEASPNTSAKSSQAFREMLAQAKRSRPKLPTAPDSPNPNSIPGLPPVADQTDALDAWGFQPIEKIVEKAQRSGRLNCSSRMLSKIPAEIYAKLLSHASIFHPSNRPSSTYNRVPPADVDLKFSYNDEEKSSSGVAWYETVDLLHLNMSLNELTALEDEFGGFEALTNCDLHCNQLTGLPYTFGLLTNLTHLDLSYNQLSQFPVQILSLVNLLELNLSKNQLTRLWPPDWKSTLKKQLATAVKPPPISDEFLAGDRSFNSIDKSFNSTDQPSTVTDSSFAHEEFCDQFPSSPTKSYPGRVDRSIALEDGIPTGNKTNRQPLPALRKFKLSGNKLTTTSLLGPDSVQLPRNLLELDLSKNPLGDRIDVASNLRNLKKLSKLNLCSCGLSDEVFWFDMEGDYDELESEESGLLEQLTELDLSHNAIDSLGPLETFFDQHCPHQPRLAYEGQPRELAKILPQHGQGAGEVKVMVGNNFLREEARRRRKMKIMPAHSGTKPVAPTAAVPVPVVEISHPSLTNEEVKSSPAEPSSSTAVATPPNPTQTMLLKHLNQATSSLNLSSLQLTDLSEDPEDYEPSMTKMNIELLNLSNNQLPRFPIGIMGCFGSTLTTLNLSRNHLANSSDAFEAHIQAMMRIKLPELVELNLAANFLSGSPKPIIQLIIDGFECCKLKTLDLSLNQFETLDGLYDLLQRQETREAHRPFRMEKVLLDGNRIAQIDDLVRLATEIKLASGLAPSAATADMTTATLRASVQFSFLDEIGLSDNSIGQLPPVLGFLPTTRLAVARNVFRFPPRKVYDGAGGDARILGWLRERC